jgi:hypothetical protein
MEQLKRVREFAWLPILAPTTFLFIKDTTVSLASVLQPASLALLLVVEGYLMRLEERNDLKEIPLKMGDTRWRSLSAWARFDRYERSLGRSENNEKEASS